MTKQEILKKLLTRKRGVTSYEIMQLVGSVSPHSRLSELKKQGWSILRKEIEGKSYGRYFGIPPKSFGG